MLLRRLRPSLTRRLAPLKTNLTEIQKSLTPSSEPQISPRKTSLEWLLERQKIEAPLKVIRTAIIGKKPSIFTESRKEIRCRPSIHLSGVTTRNQSIRRKKEYFERKIKRIFADPANNYKNVGNQPLARDGSSSDHRRTRKSQSFPIERVKAKIFYS